MTLLFSRTSISSNFFPLKYLLSFSSEFQGGSYLPWNGPVGGCRNNTGADWVNVFYRNNIAQKVTAHNMYMLFGGKHL